MPLEQIIAKLNTKQNLTEQEMSWCLSELFSTTDEPIARQFLIALHQKGETRDEILATVRFLRSSGTQLKIENRELIDCCGTGGDARNTFNISTAVAFVLAGGGCTVAKHGNRAVSSNSGSADVLSELGVNISVSSEVAERCLREIGIGFLFAPDYYPQLKTIAQLRRTIPHRTIFNVVGPLLNPVQAKAQLIGVFDGRLTRILAEVAQAEGGKSVLVVHGCDGLDEFTLTTDSVVSWLKEDKIADFKFDPRESGYDYCNPVDLQGGDPKTNANRLKLTLKGHSQPIDHVVHINAAWGFVVAGKASNFMDGLLLAQDSISSGRAYHKLEQLIEATR